MTECKHPQVIINPIEIKAVGKGLTFSENDIERGEMFCRDCKKQLPIEDRAFYKTENVFVGVPTELVDKL